jgi:hypothetical protein
MFFYEINCRIDCQLINEREKYFATILMATLLGGAAI